MADKKIRLLVQAEVKKAVQALNKVEKEQKDIKKQNDGLKKSFAAMGGAIAAAFSIQAIANFTASAVKLGSQTISLERSFRNLGKAVDFNDQSLAKFRKATNGTVSDVDLMIQANNAMLLGIVDNDDAFAELIDNAQRLAKAVGQDALFGIESLTTGIGRQSKLMLDNLGIVLDTNLAYEKFAEANGKAVKDLDENERKQAFVQAALQSTAEKVAQLGDEELDATDATNQLAAAFENLQGTIGIELQDEVEATSGFFANYLTTIDTLIQRVGLFNFITGQTIDTLARQASEPLPVPERPDIPLLTDEDEFLPDMKIVEETYDEIDRIIAKHEEGRKKSIKFIRQLEADAHKERIQNNLQSAILQGQSAKEAGISVVKAEVAEAQAGLISSIMKALPFPLNLAVAAGAGSMIGKVTDQLFSSFATGGSFVTKGRTTLPIGNGVVVGDNASGMERIDVTPLPSPTSNGNNITINISAPLVDETVVDHIIPAIRRAEKLNL
jgi:hypothetical protein